ncbi:TPA: helix-turn-helix domain-containing protein, partial [Streptococcus pyogenes]
MYQFLNLGMNIREIAQALKRSPSTISLEIKTSRVSYTDYFPIKVN